jgi:hypothetical protein
MNKNWKKKKKVVSSEESVPDNMPVPEVSTYVESNLEPLTEGVCPLCKGSKQMLAIGKHVYTDIMKTFSVPCMCYISTTVSSQYKLLKHLGDQYMHPDKLSPQLSPDFKNLSDNENFILTGNYDALLIVIKALIMKHRFELNPPSILFSRSIDIVHDYHVPQDDGSSLHLSATSRFDLAVIVFGSNERNQAIAPCMAQLVQTRIEEKKPTWIYFPESMPALTPNSQEYSAELAQVLDKKFRRIGVKTDMKIEAMKSHTKQSVTRF